MNALLDALGLDDPRRAGMLAALLLVYCRVQACVIVMPGFSFPGLPVRLRVALAMAMTPLLAESAGPATPPGNLLGLSLACGAEIVTGLALGALVRLFAQALEVAAAALAAVTSLSQPVGAATEYPPHPIGNLLHLAGIAILMALGLPIALCQLLGDSLSLRPVGEWPQIAGLFPAAVGLLGQGFRLALILAAPFILGGYLYQLLSGMISKVMPALPVMFIATPGAILLALLALTILAPPTVMIWAEAVLDVMRNALP